MAEPKHETEKGTEPAQGKTIESLGLHDEVLRFVFTDGSRLDMADSGQSCCESRYMTTDDDIQYYVRAEFLYAEKLEAPDHTELHGGCHEAEFLVIHTSKGAFTMESHVEHNGYYGGLDVRASFYEYE